MSYQYIKLIRPHQWVKNIFVFLPILFAGRIMDFYLWGSAITVFFAFSMIASAVYCINDVRDVDADRQHPVKRLRPIASGQVSIEMAILIAIVLCIGSILLSLLSLDYKTGIVVLCYFLINLAYCFGLKQYALIDVFILSSGFVLRLAAGGFACGIELSPWIVSLTFLISLFLAFAKRRDDVVIQKSRGISARKSIRSYNLQFLDMTLGLIGAITVVSYMMYTISPDVMGRLGSRYIYVTSIFVLAGILRYLQVTIVDSRSGSPTNILLKDRFIQGCILCWTVLFCLIIYF